MEQGIEQVIPCETNHRRRPTSDPSHLLQILTALHSARHHLSLFLSHHPPPPPPENSTSSAVGEENDEPMLMGDDEDEVVWRMKEGFIQNKRPKRQLSPSSAMTAELRRAYENEAERDGPAMVPTAEFDPLGTKLRSIGPGMYEGEALGLNAMYSNNTRA